MTESVGFLSSFSKKLAGDVYDRKARLYPCLLLLFPVAATIAVFVSYDLKIIESLAAGMVTLGVAFFLMQLARDRGKQREGMLFADWGGIPSVSILRHRDARIDPVTKARLHSRLSRLVSGSTKPPTVQAEESDPVATDHIYSAWSYYLRNHTRDTEKFPLIFRENISYGYRRNLWGLRPFGLGICILCCLVVVIYQLVFHYYLEPRSSAAFGFALVMALFWWLRVSPGWIRIAAYSYADRLIEATDVLSSEKMAQQAKTTKKKP